MASSAFPALDSYSTAVVLLPSAHLQHPLNLLRSANDKSFPRWTSHITMLFPFVHPSALGDAAKRLRASLESAPLEPFPLQLDHVGKFHNKSYDTVFLAPSATTQVQTLWKTVSSTAGYKGRPFAPHLTLGQARSEVQFARLEEKGNRMIRNHDLSWDVGSIAILIKDDADGGKMKIFEEMPLGASSFAPTAIIPERPLTYAVAEHGWTALPSSESPARTDAKLRVTTFNILNDDSHAPDVRFPLLKRDIFSHPSDILCLQEVPDAFLPLLLSDAEVRSRFTYCTCAPTSVLPHWQNVVVLSSIPFAWDPVALGDNQHKTASILTFAFPRPLVLAVVHFTAGHTPPLVAKRESEAASLVVHLRTHYAGAEWVILGDTNINTDWLPTTWSEAMDDAWSLCHPEESGVTYDPIKNALAAETSHEVKTPFRYDRICVQRRGQAQVERMQVVREAEGELPASDHWALWAELDVSSLADASAQSAAVASIAGSGASSQALPEDEDAALEAWVRANGGYPSEEQETARTQAIHTLRQVLGGALSDTVHAEQLMPAPLPPGVKLVFEPVGSRMLGVDTSSSDLDVLVIGNLGQDTFFGLMRARIRAWARACRAAQAPCTLVLRRFVRDATVPMMRLQVDGVEVDLQYAPAAKVAERWAEIARLPPDDPLFSLPASTLRVLNAYRDNVRLLSLLSADRLPQFRLALRALKIFTSVRGLAGAKLGYLGGVHLTLLLARLVLSDSRKEPMTAVALLRAFVTRYAHFPFGDEILSVEGVAAGSTYRRTPREALAILSMERPLINVSAGATVPNVTTIQSELLRAEGLMRNASLTWGHVCGTADDAVRTFMTDHTAFVKVDLNFWGADAMRMRALLGYVESRLVKLLVDLSRHGASHPRLWPQPFVEGSSMADAGGATGSDRTLNLSYLIGVKSSISTLGSNSALSDFERIVHGQEHYYDAGEAYLGVNAVSHRDIVDLRLAPATLAWADGGIDPDEGDEDDEPPAAASDQTEDEAAAAAVADGKPAQARGGRLRTSADVYNRLMWDPQVDRADFAIGYEDRFEGVKEMALTGWKREVEDEAFIPFHRVVHFRRLSDGVLVWDRRKRVDLLFGSGGVSQEG